MSSQIPKREIGSRSSSSPSSQTQTPITRPTLFPGEGIGPNIAESVKQVFEAAGVPTAWEEHLVVGTGAFESVRHKGVGLKGPLTTPIGKHYLLSRSDKVRVRSPKQD